MTMPQDGDVLVWISAGLASLFIVTSVLVICAEFRRKSKPHFTSEPTLLKLQKAPHSTDANGALHPPNRHLLADQRPNSPSHRFSSLSRELPAIPDAANGPDAQRSGDGRYDESASNLYACLDDVRVVPPERGNLPTTSSARDINSIAPIPHARVHPYDRIGGPTASAGISGMPEPSTSQSHAHVLQQMDNEAEYRGARSDISYTSVTARAPLADLMTRRMSEDESGWGYTKVAGDDNHLYAQVGGEYGGSVGSELQGSAHIYNELYAEIDANGPAHHGALINPYATSAVLTMPTVNGGDGAGPSHAPSNPSLSEEDREKLYAKVVKPSRVRPNTSFVDPPGRREQENGRTGDSAGPASISRSLSDVSLRASVDAAITNMDTSMYDFVAGTPRRFLRREHVYEKIPKG